MLAINEGLVCQGLKDLFNKNEKNPRFSINFEISLWDITTVQCTYTWNMQPRGFPKFSRRRHRSEDKFSATARPRSTGSFMKAIFARRRLVSSLMSSTNRTVACHASRDHRPRQQRHTAVAVATVTPQGKNALIDQLRSSIQPTRGEHGQDTG